MEGQQPPEDQAMHQPLVWIPMDKTFMELEIPRKQPVIAHVGGYRVYRDKQDYVEVEAAFIAEAITQSGITSPYKIEKILLGTSYIYPPSQMEQLSGYGSELRMQQAMQAGASTAPNPPPEEGQPMEMAMEMAMEMESQPAETGEPSADATSSPEEPPTEG